MRQPNLFRVNVSVNWVMLLGLLTFSGLLLVSSVAFAQQTSGNVRGLVKDQNGALVPNAKVTIFDKKTNSSLTTQSSNSGEYEFKNLQGGEYQLTVEASGFKKLTLSDVLPV